MVDSREKGARAESAVKEELRKLTGLKWERTPGSGALNQVHKLKGDLYVPNEANLYCVEVKHYSDSQINHSLIAGKSPILIEWWQQAVRQGIQVERLPLLIFKHDRSKLFCAFDTFPTSDYPYIFISRDNLEFYISLLDDFIKYEKPKFIK